MGGFRDMRSPDERVYVDHHVKIEQGQGPALVHPAKSMMFGKVVIEGAEHPHITIYARCSDHGFCFLPNVDELEMLGKAMLDRAAEMRKAADAQLAAVLAKKPGA